MTFHGQDSPLSSDASEPREGVLDDQLLFPTPTVEEPQVVATFRKRDGREVSFDRRKIADAIFKAAESIGDEDRDRADGFASGVAVYLANTLHGAIPTADQVHDAVERVLIEMGHPKAALAFMRYRDKRARIRKLRQGDLRGLIHEIEEARQPALAAGGDAASLFVRTSDERLAGWERGRIVDALVRETGMEPGMAEVIALEVEAQIVAADVETLTASLVRELVDAKLIERGLEEHRRRHRRLGVPLFDAEQIICAPNHGPSEQIHDPSTTDVALAERVKKEYALTQVFSQEVADAHLSGDLHLHGLGFVDRIERCRLSPAYAIRFGVGLPGSRRFRRPPAGPAALLTQLNQFNHVVCNHVVSAVEWDAFNVFLAPFFVESDPREPEQFARMLMLAFGGAAGRRGPAPTVEVHLDWTIPRRLESVRALGPSGRRVPATYGALEETARELGKAILDAAGDRDAPGSVAAGLTPCVVIDDRFFDAPGHADWLEHVCDHAKSGCPVRFVFDREAGKTTTDPPWASRGAAVHRVTLNLPRLAYRTGSEEALHAELEDAVRCAVQAHVEKRRFIERLLSFKDLGALSLFAEEHEGRSLLDLDQAVFEVGVAGLNECVQALLGAELDASDEALALGERIVIHLKQVCDRQGVSEELRLVPAQTDDGAVTGRFAVLDGRHFAESASTVVKTDPVTQDMHYTAGVQLAQAARLTPFERVSLEGRFHDAVPAGAVTRIDLGETDFSTTAIASFVRKAFRRTRARQVLLLR